MKKKWMTSWKRNLVRIPLSSASSTMVFSLSIIKHHTRTQWSAVKWCLLFILRLSIKSFPQKYVKKYWHYLSFTAACQTHQFFYRGLCKWSSYCSPVIAKSSGNPSRNNLEITAFTKLSAKCPNVSEN